MHDQAFVLEDSVQDAHVESLLAYARGLSEYREASDKVRTAESFYRFVPLSHNSKPVFGLPGNVAEAVEACNRVVLETVARNTAFPALEEDYSGVSICSNYSMPYHADAERPYCTRDRNLGVPEASGDSGFLMPSKNEWQPNHTPTRVYTALVYLTDDFEGGETTMPLKGLDVEPERGRMFGFPCSRDYIHGIRRNSGAVRIAFTAWYMLSKKAGGDPYGNRIKTCA
jgi:hypothetical protein